VRGVLGADSSGGRFGAAAARVVTAPSIVGIASPTNWGVFAMEGALSPCQRLANVVLPERQCSPLLPGSHAKRTADESGFGSENFGFKRFLRLLGL
jgi:hypothetical protein